MNLYPREFENMITSNIKNSMVIFKDSKIGDIISIKIIDVFTLTVWIYLG